MARRTILRLSLWNPLIRHTTRKHSVGTPYQMGTNLGVTSVFGQHAAKADVRAAISGLASAKRRSASQSSVNTAVMMTLDVLAVAAALYLALHIHPGNAGTGTACNRRWPLGRRCWCSLDMLSGSSPCCWFSAGTTGSTSRLRSTSKLHEVRMTVQACVNAGLLLCGAMYMTHDTLTPRAVVVSMVGFTTALHVPAAWMVALLRASQSGEGRRREEHSYSRAPAT